MSLVNVIGYGFAAMVTWSFVQYLRSGEVKRDFEVFHKRPWTTWLEILCGNVVVLTAILGIVLVCYEYGPKFLDWSWLDLLADDKHPSQGANLMVAGSQIPVFGVIFVLLLMVNLPRLAAREERQFRLGTKSWKDAVPRSLTFGFAHMIVGVPLCVGLALSLGGLWFTFQYFRGGIARSTMAHAVYNLMIALVLLVYVTQQTAEALSHVH